MGVPASAGDTSAEVTAVPPVFTVQLYRQLFDENPYEQHRQSSPAVQPLSKKLQWQKDC